MSEKSYKAFAVTQKVASIIAEAVSFFLVILTLAQFFNVKNVLSGQIALFISFLIQITLYLIYKKFLGRTGSYMENNNLRTTVFPKYTLLCIYITRFVCCALIICLALFTNLTKIEHVPLSSSPAAIIYMVAVFIIILAEMFIVYIRLNEWAESRKHKKNKKNSK